jgi:hypothetical protein
LCEDFIGLSALNGHASLLVTMKILGAHAMKRLGIGAILLAMLAGPAFAQQPSMDDKDPAAQDRAQKLKDRDEIDKRYKSTLEKTRQETAPVRTDPWSNMRGADDSKTKR